MANKPTFSLFLPQAAMDYEMIRERALAIEDLGYDGLWLVDHLMAGGLPDVDFIEGWTAISALAEATSRLRLGLLVTCNSFRNPGIVAKMATTVDHISKGRCELGMGAGWLEEEYRAYGYDFPAIGTRIDQLEESLEIITGLFSGQTTTFKGRHYSFENAPFMPKPLQKPLPITIGGGGKRRMMGLVARFAQRWNCPMPSAHELSQHLESLKEHCRRVGRDMAEISISEQTAIVIGRDRAEVEVKKQMAQVMIGSFVDLSTMALIGTPDEIIVGLRKKMRAGVDDFAILFGDFGMPDTLELFATEVAAKLRKG
ncbi:MAG: TIGR03560 family F420-dependent LLM class oxidoreductase [Deltaproteobacteria bacterium]|jgi:F420-dependent oxidoreductase-like protein